MGNTDTILIIRCHLSDDYLYELAAVVQNEVGFSVCFAADESKGPLSLRPDFQKIALNSTLIETMEVLAGQDVLYKCGDYCFYAARERFPEAKAFWLIEPDVRINFRTMREFFDLYLSCQEVDLLAAYLQPAREDWYWRQTMLPFASKIYRCFFPLVRLSGKAVDRLHSRRREMTKAFKAKSQIGKYALEKCLWPNDEAFTATTLKDEDFRCEDLNSQGRTVYNQNSFVFEYPTSHSRYSTYPTDNTVYHPVLSGRQFTGKLLSRCRDELRDASNRDAVRSAFCGKKIINEVCNEVGEEATKQFLSEVQAMLDGLPSRDLGEQRSQEQVSRHPAG